MKQLVSVLAVGLLLAACGSAATELAEEPAATQPPAVTEAPEESDVEPTAQPATEAPPTEQEPTPTESPTPTPPTREDVTFLSDEGMRIEGWYFPPTSGPAPGVLLFHQRLASKADWAPFITQLRAERPNYAVMAIDFPGHGDSEEPYSRHGALSAARSALAEFRTYEDVDGDRIVIVGASIGSDAAVDECGEGCIGAVSVSPGSWLDVPFTDALTALRDAQDPPVLCITSEFDDPSPETCSSGESVGLSDYDVYVYEGESHGNEMFYQEEMIPPPLIGDLVIKWMDGIFAE